MIFIGYKYISDIYFDMRLCIGRRRGLMPEKHTKKKLYEEVRDGLIDLILDEEMTPQDPLPSEGEIAQRFGVSKMTAKIALNILEEEGVILRLARRGSFLTEDYKEKVAALIRKIPDYEKAEADKKFFALVVPSLDSYLGRIVEGIIDEAERNRWHVILRINNADAVKENEILRELSSSKIIKGIILFPTDRVDCGSELLSLKLKNFPVVIIDRTFREVAFDCVYHNHYQGAYDITKYLIEKGHRRIGFVSHKVHSVLSREDRYQGYLHSLLDHNVSIHKEFILFIEEDEKELHDNQDVHILDISSFSVLEKYLRDNPLLSAVFCSNDYEALELYLAAQKMGLRVPEDISIVGFSNN